MTLRNAGLIAPEIQAALRRTRIVVAGCGSTGGAVLMPLVRTGAERFVLFDPGTYELSNLNRQEASVTDVGLNKAQASAARMLAANPYCAIEVHGEGVRSESIASLLREGDLVF